MTTIEGLWWEMEDEGGTGWRLRQTRKDVGHALVAALEPGGTRVLLVRVGHIELPPRHQWPECRGLEWLSVSLDATAWWGVRLRDRTCLEVFSVLARDLDERLIGIGEPENAAKELFARLTLWQQFLKAWREGMSPESRRGLWGELHFLRSHLLPALGPTSALDSWKAGSAAHQDFQFGHAAVELKTTSAKPPQTIRITSERQLDETGVGILFLHVVIVDEREVGPDARGNGLSLPGLVTALRNDIAAEPPLLNTFNDLLLDRGWLDELADRWEDRKLTVRDDISLHVADGFPRLVEQHLPDGIGSVSYSLSLAACGHFRTATDRMLKVLANPPDLDLPSS